MNRPPRGAALVEDLLREALLTEVAADLPVEERQQPRFEPVSEPLEVRFTTHERCAHVALLADISVSGARFVADYVPAEDEIIQLIFSIAGRRRLLNGRVCHVGAPDGEVLCFFGVEFTNQPVRAGRLTVGSGTHP